MNQFQRTRRVVGAAYAATHADPRTLDVLRALDRENEALRVQVDAIERQCRARMSTRWWRLYVVWKAAQRSDYLVREHLRLLQDDNRQLRKALRSARPPVTPSGRYLYGRMVSSMLLGCAMLVGAAWWGYSPDSAALRSGARSGSLSVYGATRLAKTSLSSPTR